VEDRDPYRYGEKAQDRSWEVQDKAAYYGQLNHQNSAYERPREP
jgi:hypothetical protein